MKTLVTLAVVLSLAAAPALASVDISELPAGTYQSDQAHTSVTFRLLHMGMSHYTARFAKVDETLQLDPKKPEASTVTATIDPASLRTDYPDVARVDFDKELAGAAWLDAAQYPQITFTSTKLVRIGGNRGRMTGDLTLHGVTKPVTLDVTMNGAYVEMPMLKIPAVGFSARGTIKRSDFGLDKGIPMVGDEITVEIETEFHKAG